MIFIEVEELKVRKVQSLIDSISDDTNSFVDSLERMAIEEVSSYLTNLYDTEFTFNRTGTQRNYLIVRTVLDFMIYFLYERVNSNEMPESIKDRYKENKEYLTKVSEGKIVLNLPKLDPTADAQPFMSVKSISKFNDLEYYG